MKPQPSDLLGAWAAWKPREPPFVLEVDRPILESESSVAATVSFSSWQAAHESQDFCAPRDTRLHLGLIPTPFVGNMRRASVYVLLLNPGLGPQDYFGEYEVRDFRAALLANLRQDFRDGEPFLFLDPRYAWHGGFGWWHGKLAFVMERLAERWQVPFAEARKRLASQLACVELLPYHSATFRNRSRWLRDLPSVSLARNFALTAIMARVRSGDAIAVVTRQSRVWGLPKHKRVVSYDGQQARAAHLSPNSLGGQAIIRHLTRS